SFSIDEVIALNSGRARGRDQTGTKREAAEKEEAQDAPARWGLEEDLHRRCVEEKQSIEGGLTHAEGKF
ncbi:hypothetical protein ACFLVX_05525, partial [Chloroflexota bacterium]